jgi:tetratricopeptide (TPR) repeat protein
VRVLERGVELFPQDLERLKALVDAYVGAGEPKKALAQIQVAFRASPRNPDVLEMLSSTFLALKQPDKSKAVDVELVKLYRQKGDTEKAAGVESRIQGSALQAKASEKEHQAPQPEDIQDPIESLIKALPLTADEKKVLSECEVYFKYGLVEKAHEVLKNRLSQFPQSLILRWKMKAAAQELKKMDETAHLLSEIILLAKTQKLEIWSNLAATELQALDPNHPSLSGNSKAPNPKASEAPIPAPKKDSPVSLAGDVRANAPAKKVAEADDFSFEGSEVSIVIDDELSVDADFSDISLQDLSSPTPKKTEETTFELEESAASEPEAKEAPSEELDSSSDSILSESDFTAEELDQLGMQLAPDEPKVEMKFDENTVNADDIVLPENPPHEPAPSVVESQKAPVASMSSDDATSPIEIEIRMDEGDDDGTKLELSDGPEVMDGADFEIRQGLEEIQFFRSQGLIDEADSLLQTLKTKFPHHPEWTASPLAQDAKAKGHGAAESSAKKVLEVETLGRKMKLSVEEDNRSESEGDFYDLAGELDQELSAPETATTTEVKEVFSAFKKGVAAAVSEEDWQTHFDLGVAYREMGLHEDAIAEFKIVSKAHGQKISALYQMGVTRTMQEKYEDARNFFDQALKEPGLGGHEKLSVSYELGEVLLKLNDKAKAKKLFEDVKKMDPEFREVKEKIRAAG